MAETDLKKLYAGRILELAADIPHSERLEAPDASVKKRSPLCGSTVTVDVSVTDGRISDFGVLEPARDFKNRHASIMLALEATAEAMAKAQAEAA